MHEQRQSVLVLAWSQTRVDGWVGLAMEDLEAGMQFRWHGVPMPLTGVGHLGSQIESRQQAILRAKAAQTVKKLMAQADANPRPVQQLDGEGANDELVVSDGLRFFTLRPVWSELTEPLLLVQDALPPAGCDLTIIRTPTAPKKEIRNDRAVGLSSDTLLATPDGWRMAGALKVGDLVHCKDHKVQPVRWCRSLPLPTAPLEMPRSHRPIRIKSSDPALSVTVCPGQRLMMAGPALDVLWAEETVLVAAGDLLHTRWASPDHIGGLARYTQIVLPFHDLIATPCGWVDSVMPDRLLAGPLTRTERRTLKVRFGRSQSGDFPEYMDPCRRVLTKAEAAIALEGDPWGLFPVAH